MKRVTAELVAQLAQASAAAMHAAWRKTYLDKFSDGKPYAPRWKATKYGRTWGALNAGKPFCKVADGETFVDIAAVEFEALPKDWQFENLEAARVALNAAADQLEIRGVLDGSALAEIAVVVHAQWTARRLTAVGLKKTCQLDEYDSAQLKLCVPFGDLPAVEQEKDLKQAEVAAKALLDAVT